MAEDAEMIGGIKVSAEVTDAGLDQKLAQIEGKLKTAAERWQGLLSVHATATGPTVAGGAAPGPAPAPLSEQVSFRRGGGVGGGGKKGISGPDVASAYERAIAEALAAEQGFDKSAAAATQATQQHRETVVKNIQATTPPPIVVGVETTDAEKTVNDFARTTGKIDPIAMSVDDSTARTQLTEFIAFLKGEVAAANEAATITPRIDVGPAQAQAAAGGGGRRGGGRGRAQQTFFDPDDSENEELRKEASAAQARVQLADKRTTQKEAPPSDAEAKFLAVLENVNAPENQEPTGNQTGRLRFVDQLEKQRRDEARGKGEGPLDVNRVEASLNKQREAAAIEESRTIQQRQLQEMSYEAEHEGHNVPSGLGTGFAPVRRRSPQEIAEIERARAARTNQAAPEPEPQPQPEQQPFQQPAPQDDPFREYSEARARLLDEHTEENAAAFRAAQQRMLEIDQQDADLARNHPPPQQPPPLSDEEYAQQTAGGENFAPPRSDEEQERRRQEQEQQRNQQAGAPPPPPGDEAARRARNSEYQRRQNEAGRDPREEAERAARGSQANRAAAAAEGRPRTSALSPQLQEEVIQARIERQRSALAAGSRTGRVAASGLGALFFGTRGREIEASARLAAAEKDLTAIERAALPILEQRKALEDDVRLGRRGAAEELRQFTQDDDVRETIEEQEAAQKRYNSALAETQKLQSGPNVVRNLAAITGGTLAFGAALGAVSFGLHAAIPAIGDWIDAQGGYAAKATAVTSALAQQTIAQKGNVDAVIAQAAATAGLSAATTDFLSTQLKTTTQIKAGALAAQQASDLFRAGAGVQQQQGLAGGFGGVLGSSFLGQQLGGGKGVAEIIAGDIKALGGTGKQIDAPLFDRAVERFDKALSYLSDEGFREFVNQAGVEQGNPAPDMLSQGVGSAAAILGQVNPISAGFNLATGNFNPIGTIQDQFNQITAPPGSEPQRGAGAQFNPLEGVKTDDIEQLNTYINDVNAAAGRGKDVLGDLKTATIGFAQTGKAGEEELKLAKQAAIAANNQYALSLAQESKIVFRVNGEIADTAEELNMALTQVGVGRGIPDPETLGRLSLAQERQRQIESRASVPAMRAQFEFERPAVVAAAEREQQFQLNTQLPAQAALQNLAQPMLPPGTGILAANADEQERIKDATKETADIQEQLNDYYEQGMKVLVDTYQIPPALINSIAQVGQQIASIQANIRNQQAAYQVEQYNYQLRIARRTLADIGGLTGRNFGEGQSYLGVLEKQNLALSRQAQLMQFSMQQRQINFQVALAGFEAPGVTPEERQARVKEAEIEAGFAQKQLNIQRQMFGNQVQIVDIQNLRAGADLAAQINLLLQGRQLTIDTAIAEEKLLHLQRLQAQQVAEAGTYIEKVNKLTARAFSEVQALETAAGDAMVDASQYALDEFGITLDKMVEEFNSRVSEGGRARGGSWDTTSSVSSLPGGVVPGGVEREIEVKLNTANAQKQLAGINEQQTKIAENVGGYLVDVTKTVTKTSRQVNKLEGEVGDALGRATTAQVNALYLYFTAAQEMWSSFFSQVAKTAQPQGGEGQSGWGPQHASGFVGMTTGTTMTGAGVMGEAGQEAYAILRNPKQIMGFGDFGGGGGDTYIIQFNNPVIREEQDMDKLAQKVMALTGREAALRGLRSVS